MESRTFTNLVQRSTQIFAAIQDGTIQPNSDAIAELAELTRALEDAPVKPLVVARLTIVRRNGLRTIVEVWNDATFYGFFHFFRQVGSKRSTKEVIRDASRNEGVQIIGGRYSQRPGLEAIVKKLEMYSSQSNPVVSTKLRIIKKRAYRNLLSARPDELGLVKSRVHLPLQNFSPLVPINASSLLKARVQS